MKGYATVLKQTIKRPQNLLQMTILVLCLTITLAAAFVPPPASVPLERYRMLAIALVAFLLWIFEVVPIQLTALIIIFLEFALQVVPFTTALNNIAHPLGLLLLAGFSLSAGIQKCHLDTFIIGKIIKYGGRNVRRLLLVIMYVVACLSMWISNTATSAIMMPFAVSVVSAVKGPRKNIGKAYTIGIAYAATIGGVGTPVGTTTNPIVIASVKEMLGITINFFQWLMIGLPFVLLLVPVGWLLLLKTFPPELREFDPGQLDHKEFDTDISNPKAVRMLVIFALLVLLWLSEVFIPLPGYWIYKSSFFIAILLYIPYLGVLDWSDAKKHVDWGVIVIVAGGMALGKGLVATRTIDWLIRSVLPGLEALPAYLTISILAGMTGLGVLLFCGITATASTFVPIAIILALSLGENPVLFAATAGISSCFAFLLPASTAPNAIAFGTRYFTTREMLKVGIPMLAVSVGIVILISVAFWPLIL